MDNGYDQITVYVTLGFKQGSTFLTYTYEQLTDLNVDASILLLFIIIGQPLMAAFKKKAVYTEDLDRL